MFDVQLPDETASTLPGQTEPAFRAIGVGIVDIQVQPDRPGARRTPDINPAVAVPPDFQRAIGHRKLAGAIVTDRGADIVKHHLVNHRPALQGLGQTAGVQTDALILRFGSGQGVIPDLNAPDGGRPPRCDNRLPNRQQCRQAQNLGPRRATVVVANQRGIVPSQGCTDSVIAARQVNRRGIAQRRRQRRMHVGDTGCHVLPPMVRIGIAQRHPARQIADRGAAADIAVRKARRVNHRARSRGLASDPCNKGGAGAEPGIVLHRAAARHRHTGRRQAAGNCVGGQVDGLVGQRLRRRRQHHGATGIRCRHRAGGARRDARHLELQLFGGVHIVGEKGGDIGQVHRRHRGPKADGRAVECGAAQRARHRRSYRDGGGRTGQTGNADVDSLGHPRRGRPGANPQR